MNSLRKISVGHWDRLLKVIEHKNYQKAGEDCHCDAKTIRASIETLENSYQVPLIHSRGKKPLDVTWQAERIAEAWIDARALLNCALEDVRLPEGLWGLLRIGCQAGHWGNFVDLAVSQLNQHACGARIRVHIHKYPVLVEKLKEGAVDMVIFYDQPPELNDHDYEYLGDETLKLFSSKEPTSLSPETLLNFVDIDWGDNLREQIIEYLTECNQGQRPPFGLHINDGNSALAHFHTHLALGYFPQRMVQLSVDNRLLYEVPGTQSFTRKAYLMARTGLLERARGLSPEAMQRAWRGISVAPEDFKLSDRNELHEALKYAFYDRIRKLQSNLH